MRRFVTASFLALVLLAPTAATAQEKRSVGLSMGFPSSVALLWHATDRVAVRPEFTFSTGTTEIDGRESDADGWSAAISALFYVMERDALSAYLAPGYVYGRSSSENDGPGVTSESIGNAHQFNASFGVQYRLGARFSVFGETGLAFSTSTSETTVQPAVTTLGEAESTSTRSGTRGAVGIVFYF